MNGYSLPAPDADVINRALLQLAAGTPELVVVDARVLRVLMGDLAYLIILGPALGQRPPGASYDPDEDGYVWDSDDLC